jgi:hypothetical protein
MAVHGTSPPSGPREMTKGNLWKELWMRSGDLAAEWAAQQLKSLHHLRTASAIDSNGRTVRTKAQPWLCGSASHQARDAIR